MFMFKGAHAVDCSVPRGFVLSVVELIAHIEDIIELFRRHQLHYHIYMLMISSCTTRCSCL